FPYRYGGGLIYPTSGGFRPSFFSEAFFLDCSRFSTEDLVGLVGFRFLGNSKAFFSTSKKRFTTSSLFLCWLRASSHCSNNAPSLVNREESLSSKRSFSASESPSEEEMLKVSSTLEETLFTCCPPAPLLRTALNASSLCTCCLFNLKALIDGLQSYVKENKLSLGLFF